MSSNQHQLPNAGKRLVETFALIALIAAMAMLGLPQFATAQTVAKEALENALLAEDWSKVAKLLESVESDPQKSPDPVLRLIKGHACLALNRNNESVQFLLSVGAPNDLEQCRRWALGRDGQTGFAGRNSRNTIAQYFKGDILAREERWGEALEAFKDALTLNTNQPLVLNAYGCVHCAVGEWDKALVDLTRATLADPQLADGYASLGAMWIQRRSGPDGAMAAFNKALQVSEDFALAHNGRGCATFALGEWKEARESFRQAKETLEDISKIHGIVFHNLSIVTIALKRAEFPFFARCDFVNWQRVKAVIADPKSILHRYFAGAALPGKVDESVVERFNALLETPGFYDAYKKRIDVIFVACSSADALLEIRKLIQETAAARGKRFNELMEDEKAKIRKLNRLILECMLPNTILQLAVAKIDSPGFSLDRDAGFVPSSNKWNMGDQDLQSGLNRMQDIYKPMANAIESVPIIGGAIGKNWNDHLDNQIDVNNHILESRGHDMSTPGGVDFDMRRAHVQDGRWGVGTWFGLGYHVEIREVESSKDGK